MTRGAPFIHLQLPYPQFTTTALLWVAVARPHGLVLVSLPSLGCLAWIHDLAPPLPPESRSWEYLTSFYFD